MNSFNISNKSFIRSILLVFILFSTTTVFGASTEVSTEPQKIYDISVFWLLSGSAVFLLFINGLLLSAIRNMSRVSNWYNNSGTRGTASVVTLLLLFSSLSTFAADGGVSSEPFLVIDKTVLGILISINSLLFISAVSFAITLKNLAKLKLEPEAEDDTADEPSFFENVLKNLTKTVPIHREKDVLLDHDYDGIKELDNVLPPWWKMMFYGSIVFGIIYFIHFHVTKTGDLSIEEYNKSVAQAELEISEYKKNQKDNVNETSVTVLMDESRIESGKKIFEQNCSNCHGQFGEGGVGPNFSDQYWIHGGDIKDIFKTIKYGVPAKGMISWKSQLSPASMQEVASYILNFQGTNPPNGKAPEGELYSPVKDESSVPSDSTSGVDSVNVAVEVIPDSLTNQ